MPALANLERGVPGVADAWNGPAFLDSWVDDPRVRGSYAGFGPRFIVAELWEREKRARSAGLRELAEWLHVPLN